MGLDTVELAYSFERYFKLEIPNAVSEKLYTVGDVATWFSQQLGLEGQRQSAVRATVWEQLRTVLAATNGKAAFYSETTPLREVLPDQ